MERVNNILNNDKYKEYLELIENLESGREFCRHDLKHFIDVARIAYILVLENGIDIEKELVYAAALLHDIGRWVQYKNGIPHDDASAGLSEEILIQSGFDENERTIILNAIRHHRNGNEELNNFDSIFSRSDKLSRECYKCKVAKQCKWNDDRKNYRIIY
jgi:uncharacterized protein